MKLRNVCFLLTLVFILISCPTDGILNPGSQTPQTVATPSAMPAGGTYASAQTVTLVTATPDAAIFYTLDGTAPSTGSSYYTGAITISATSTLKAIAVKTGMTHSAVLTETYTITPPGQVAKPTATPAGRNYTTTQTVTLATSTSGADIYYTINGTEPTTNSTKYSSAITISTTSTLKAIAVKTGMTHSAVLTETYTITSPVPTTFTVTYYADGGTPAPTSPVTVNPGSAIAQPSAMTKTWHTFGGWYTDSARTVPALFPITVNGNVNLYARWILNTLTSIADVSSYLASLPANTVNNPASLSVNINLGTMTAAGSGWQRLAATA